ncbi:Uncharacterised protein [Vibrio cholerae]|nr:Uncharacterised protein [Vibrio cholerae]
MKEIHQGCRHGSHFFLNQFSILNGSLQPRSQRRILSPHQREILLR